MSFESAEAAWSALHAGTASAADLRQIVLDYPALRPHVAWYPQTDPALLEWLRSFHDPAIDAQLAQRRPGPSDSGAGSQPPEWTAATVLALPTRPTTALTPALPKGTSASTAATASAAPLPPTQSRRWLLPVIAVAAGLILAGGVGFGLWRWLGSDAAPTTPPPSQSPLDDDVTAEPSFAPSTPITLTPCASAPTARPGRVADRDMNLVVTVELTAVCRNGDVLTAAEWPLTVFLGNTSQVIAAGMFDLRASPIYLTGTDPVTVDLVFPAGQFWQTAAQLGSTATLTAEVTDGAPLDATPLPLPTPLPRPPTQLAAVPGVLPAGVDLEAIALDALNRQLTHDAPLVTSTLQDRWSTVLTAKRPGLEWGGQIWTNQAILSEYQALRALHPTALIIRSSDYTSTGLTGDWLQTLSGLTYSDADAALAWCTAQRYDDDHCFAIKLTHGSREGTTKHNR